MRSVIVATLALTPMLLHAQANSPAQPQTSGTSTTLQSKLIRPNDIVASEADHAAAHVAGSIDKAALAKLNDMVTQQAATVAIIDQFKILMLAMLIVSPLVLFLRKPRPAS